MECIHIYHSCLIRTKQFTIIYIILIKLCILSVMYMHGFTILLGYGLRPFVCSEQIVYTCFFIFVIKHGYTSACIRCIIYLSTNAFIMIEVSKFERYSFSSPTIVLPHPHPSTSRGNISLNNWNNMCRVYDTLCKKNYN